MWIMGRIEELDMKTDEALSRLERLFAFTCNGGGNGFKDYLEKSPELKGDPKKDGPFMHYAQTGEIKRSSFVFKKDK